MHEAEFTFVPFHCILLFMLPARLNKNNWRWKLKFFFYRMTFFSSHNNQWIFAVESYKQHSKTDRSDQISKSHFPTHLIVLIIEFLLYFLFKTEHVSENLVFCRIVKCYLSKYLKIPFESKYQSTKQAGLIALELSKYKLNQNYNFIKLMCVEFLFNSLAVWQENYAMKCTDALSWESETKNSCFLYNQNEYPCMIQ